MIIQTLVFIFAGILILNTVFTAILWSSLKDPLLKYLFFFWICGLGTFMLQGVFNQTNIFGFLAFSTHSVAIYLLLRIYSESTQAQFPWSNYVVVLSLGLFMSVLLFIFDFSFTTSALPFSISCVIILLYSSFLGFKTSKNALNGGFSALLFLNALHFGDYAFIRPIEKFAIFGFSVALGFYFLYSIYIPLFVFKKISDRDTANLENEVLKRTTDLRVVSEKLEISNKHMELNNQELSHLVTENRALLSMLVHDLSNPLQILFSQITRIRLKPKEIDMQNFADRTNRAISSIQEILKTVRELHALKIGKKVAQITNVSLMDVLSDSLLLYEDRFKEKHIQVLIDKESLQNLYIEADPALLKNQIFSNIISNAIKFSHANGAFQLRAFEDDLRVKVCFRDYGIGIPKGLQEKIFEMEAPTHRKGTSGESGTGMGLPIVKEYMSLMGGSIRLLQCFENESGTCFELEFKKSIRIAA